MTASEPGRGGRDPVEAALDLLLFAPLGLALSAVEEIPKLAAIGRARFQPRMDAARVVGRFAVEQGRRQAERRLSEAIREGMCAVPKGGSGGGPAPVPPAAPRSRRRPRPDRAQAGPEAGGLAIPGYDSLSASQVVQRLAGLDRQELSEVRDYEEAHRGRRTVLTRIDQLQGR